MPQTEPLQLPGDGTFTYAEQADDVAVRLARGDETPEPLDGLVREVPRSDSGRDAQITLAA